MAYAVVADLQNRFGQDELIRLTDPTGVAVNATRVNQAIADAGAIIDSYIASIYDLPLPSLPPRLNECCCNVARYALYDDLPTENVMKRYEAEISWLKDVAKGIATLGLDPADDPPRSSGGILVSSAPRVFTQ